jgi:hypothetical protein
LGEEREAISHVFHCDYQELQIFQSMNGQRKRKLEIFPLTGYGQRKKAQWGLAFRQPELMSQNCCKVAA